ncbi:MAG: hypothetical protein JWM57_836, partial [Phycisphaerales bacterium]|nr:hypothetical protein [Phycisphaerales bacterium]
MFKTLLIAAMSLVSAAQAATVTFVLSPFDNGTGTLTQGKYAVYAFTSRGDNAGLAAFSFTITGGPITSAVNNAPQARFDPEDDTIFAPRVAGLSLYRTEGASAGLPSYAAVDTVSPIGLESYGLGQSIGNLNSRVPDGYIKRTPDAQARYGVTHGIDYVELFQTAYTNGMYPVLLQTGNLQNASSMYLINTAANVFSPARDGRVMSASVQWVVGNFVVPEPTALGVV